MIMRIFIDQIYEHEAYSFSIICLLLSCNNIGAGKFFFFFSILGDDQGGIKVESHRVLSLGLLEGS